MATNSPSRSAGEVCSLAVAEEINIRDYSGGYYIDGYSDVKTYNEAEDTRNNADIYKLCDEITNRTGSKAAPLCVLQSNAGFGFTRQKGPNSIIYNECVTAECPDGFKVDPKNPNSCIKPKKPKTTFLKNINEERWHDWFMVPDYHLGNKYERVGDTNFAPCIKGSIPSYEKDPVDGLQRIFNSSNKDDLKKCVDKTHYLGGKYLKSETHCPLAWVYRVGATNKDLKEMYNDLINDIDDSGNEHLDTLKNEIDDKIYEQIYKPVISYGFADYIGKSQTEEAKVACAKLDTANPQRKSKAFTICNTIHQLGKEGYIQKLMRENNEDELIATQKYRRAVQACHTLFCNYEGEQKLCFPEVEKAELNMFYNIKFMLDSYSIDPKKHKEKVMKWFGNIALSILLISAFVVALIYGYPKLKIIACYIRWIGRIIMRQFFTNPGTSQYIDEPCWPPKEV
jgi:hypothetical protein